MLSTEKLKIYKAKRICDLNNTTLLRPELPEDFTYAYANGLICRCGYSSDTWNELAIHLNSGVSKIQDRVVDLMNDHS